MSRHSRDVAVLTGGYCAWCQRWIDASGQPGAALTPEEKARVESHSICQLCAERLRADHDYIGTPRVRLPSSIFRTNGERWLSGFGWYLLLFLVSAGLIYIFVDIAVWVGRDFLEWLK